MQYNLWMGVYLQQEWMCDNRRATWTYHHRGGERINKANDFAIVCAYVYRWHCHHRHDVGEYICMLGLCRHRALSPFTCVCIKTFGQCLPPCIGWGSSPFLYYTYINVPLAHPATIVAACALVHSDTLCRAIIARVPFRLQFCLQLKSQTRARGCCGGHLHQ